MQHTNTTGLAEAVEAVEAARAAWREAHAEWVRLSADGFTPRQRFAAYGEYVALGQRWASLVGNLRDAGYGTDGRPLFDYVGHADAWAKAVGR